MDRLKAKRALITGGTTGIGLETARQFLAEGARVAITGTNPSTLDAARKDLGEQVLVLPSDASDIAAQKKLAADIAQAFGQLDILVVNAGIADLRPLEQWDEAGFDRSFAINVKGPLFLIQSLLPVFANPASIVLTTSVNAHIGMANTSVYGASKAALLSFTKTLSGELVPRGIRVNAVSPGPITTPLYGKLGLPKADLEKVAGAIKGQVPAGRFGDASEVAKAIVFLASDEAPFTVGGELLMDGGMSL
jgi:NAD(P)-dependent dehydrogenase (short-subunit alcohol dehydrogenase family)